MKVCPFCKEEIRDEAIKCRYCQSSLLPPQPARETPQPAAPTSSSSQGADKGNTVLIVDSGLIFFGKFVAGALAIFVTIGIFLYGIDIKESLKDVESSTQAAKSSAQDMAKIELSVQKAQGEVEADQGKAKAASDDAATKIAALQQQLQDAQANLSQTSDAAKKAQAAQAQMASEQKAFEQSRQDAEGILTQAKSTLDEIHKTQQAVDAAAANVIPLANSASQASKALATAASGTTATEPASTSASPSASSATPTKAAADRPFSPTEFASVYNFPSNLNGSGQTVGIIELGGGYDPKKLDAYFKKIGKPTPKITSVGIDGGKNLPTGPQGADGEVQLSIEAVGAVAPSAEIVVYFCPNTNQGFVDGISTAIHDDVHRISVLSISWGSPEANWTRQAMTAMNAALQEAAGRRITVVAAAGDNGPSDGMMNGQLAVDFPASSPWVTAVGGTELRLAGTQIESETAWDDSSIQQGSSGRGTSTIFPIPDWQTKAGAQKTAEGYAGRAIPDVVADAAPKTGYAVEVDGQAMVVGGTAAASPLWAGFIALLNQGLGHNIGFFNEELYTKLGPKMVLRRVGTVGANGSSTASSGWSPVTGWGAPDGEKLLEALRQP